MKKVVFLSHCILNPMCESPEASDLYRKEIFDVLHEKKCGIIQLPCPELCYQALIRESIEPGMASAKEYKAYCNKLLEPILKNIEEYRKNNIEIAALIGVDTSPSCSVANERAIFTEVFLKAIGDMSVEVGMVIDMPISNNIDAGFLEEVKKI